MRVLQVTAESHHLESHMRSRRSTFWFVVFSVFLCVTGNDLAAQESSQVRSGNRMTDDQLAKTLVGSWRIIDAHRDGKTSELHMSCITLKHITPTQFTWLSYRPDERTIFRSMGGSWKIETGMYVETPQYGTQEGFAEGIFGRSVAIGAEVDGDLFTQTIESENGSKFIEIWQRVKPGEDWRKLPKQD